MQQLDSNVTDSYDSTQCQPQCNKTDYEYSLSTSTPSDNTTTMTMQPSSVTRYLTSRTSTNNIIIAKTKTLIDNNLQSGKYLDTTIKQQTDITKSGATANYKLDTTDYSKLSTKLSTRDQNEIEYSTEFTISDEFVNDTTELDYYNSTLILNFLKMYPIDLWRKHGYFTTEYLKLINPHWLKYPPTSELVHYTLAAIYSMICVFGISGNFLVIYMFLRCRSLRTPANTLIINLAISDLTMMSKTPLFIYNSLYLGPALGEFACEMYGFIGGLTGTVSIITLAAISIDRYLVIIYPLDPNKRFTGLRAKACIITTWIYGAIFSTLPLTNLGCGKYIPEGLLTSCSFDYLSPDPLVKQFIFIFFCAAWVLPFCIIVFCYMRILKVVVNAQKLVRDHKSRGSISSRHFKDEEKRRTEIKLAGVVIIVIMLWFLAWTPYAIVALLGISGHQDLITPITSMAPALFCKIASCIDPFIYAVTHPRFRCEIRNMMLRISRRERKGTIRQSQYSVTANLSETPASMDPTAAHQLQQLRTNSITSNASDGNVEEIMVMVNLPAEKEDLLRENNPNQSNTTPNKASADCLKRENVSRPPSWYVKPSFARQSSIKTLARHLSVKRDDS